MEEGKRQRRIVSPLNLHQHLYVRDVHPLVWHHLSVYDREMVWCAHNSQRIPQQFSALVVDCMRNNYMARLDWLYARAPDAFHARKMQLMRYATRYGTLEVLQWLARRTLLPRQTTRVYRQHAMLAAVERGCLDTLHWLYERDLVTATATFRACLLAASLGHADILEWIMRGPERCPIRATDDADYDYDTDDLPCERALEHGHLNVLQALRRNGRAWDVDVCEGAATWGHLHILQWAVDAGAHWDPHACEEIAREAGHPHITAWIRSLYFAV